MITPPLSTPSFYVAKLEDRAAEYLMSLLSPQAAEDVQNVFITSKDVGSDIEATNELQSAATKIIHQVSPVAPEQRLKYNPMYLPNDKPLDTLVEFDQAGDVTSVDGFENPFVSLSLTCQTDDASLFDGRVMFRPFPLPSMEEAMNKTILLS